MHDSVPPCGLETFSFSFLGAPHSLAADLEAALFVDPIGDDFTTARRTPDSVADDALTGFVVL